MMASSEEPPRLLNYARISRRFLAVLIDFAVFMPLGVLYYWLGAYSVNSAMLAEALLPFYFAIYSLYGHGRFGRTIGKYLMGLRVVRCDGSDLGFFRACRRYAVDGGLSLFSGIGAIAVLRDANEEAFHAAGGWVERLGYRSTIEPEVVTLMSWLWWAWLTIDLFVMFSNRARRALHDVIAGSVVICDPPRRK